MGAGACRRPKKLRLIPLSNRHYGPIYQTTVSAVFFHFGRQPAALGALSVGNREAGQTVLNGLNHQRVSSGRNLFETCLDVSYAIIICLGAQRTPLARPGRYQIAAVRFAKSTSACKPMKKVIEMRGLELLQRDCTTI